MSYIDEDNDKLQCCAGADDIVVFSCIRGQDDISGSNVFVDVHMERLEVRQKHI